MKLMDGFDSNYRYVLVAARRARQLQSGARPLMEPVHSRKACRIAEEEIAAGKVKWVIGEGKSAAVQAAAEQLDRAVGSK
ncbi:MAG TPA: DNA-directed RNA polymerase subunit omega [Terriglobales bacterium]|jgi:DNA-directed RNA polymerase subunit omega|nr:DNA-directed RNA polymerase subunit omega [Terriglobales bacterium]